jgi:hypothetical protein
MRPRAVALTVFSACLIAAGLGCDEKTGTGPTPEPVTVTTVGSVDLPGFGVMENPGGLFGHYPHEPVLYEGILYIPSGASDTASGILMVDVTDPSNPGLAGSSGVVESRDVAADDGTLLSVDGNSLHVFDATNALAPVLLATLPMEPGREGSATAVTVHDTVAYVAGGGPTLTGVSLQTVSIADPAAPALIGASEEAGGTDVVVTGGLAYVSCYDAGLRIYDVSAPDSLELVGELGTFGSAGKVEVEGSVVYVYNTGFEFSLAIIDASNPAQPSLLSVTPIPSDIAGSPESMSTFNGIRVSGGLAYLSAYAGTALLDVSDPGDPEIIEAIGREEFTGGVEIVGDHVAIVSRRAVTILSVEVSE